jgi:hypothetical protein
MARIRLNRTICAGFILRLYNEQVDPEPAFPRRAWASMHNPQLGDLELNIPASDATTEQIEPAALTRAPCLPHGIGSILAKGAKR